MFDEYRQKLSGLLDAMPLVQLLRGEAKVSPEGLQQSLLGMKPFQPPSESEAMNYMNAVNTIGLLGKIVYHGSPHKFDKFDASKIGTGEGAQQQGIGAYFADSNAVGRKYAEKESAKRGQGVGYLYKADIPDNIVESMGVYELPISKQPNSVKSAIRSIVDDKVKSALRNGFGWGEVDEAPLAAVMNAMDAVRWGDRAQTALDMRKAGIPGIRYLDGGSRSAGQGSYNYVVFPGLEDQVKILERNGIPLGLLNP